MGFEPATVLLAQHKAIFSEIMYFSKENSAGAIANLATLVAPAAYSVTHATPHSPFRITVMYSIAPSDVIGLHI